MRPEKYRNKMKVDLELLEEQIQFLDSLSSMMTDEYKRELVDGVVNLLDHIRWAAKEDDDEIRFERADYVVHDR